MHTVLSLLHFARCALCWRWFPEQTLIKMPKMALSKILHLSQFNRYPGFVKTGSVQMSPKIGELIVLCGREGGGISSLSAVAVTEDSSPTLPLCWHCTVLHFSVHHCTAPYSTTCKVIDSTHSCSDPEYIPMQCNATCFELQCSDNYNWLYHSPQCKAVAVTINYISLCMWFI